MRIIYLANHGQYGSNDDEGSIAYALECLGHEVVKIPERRATMVRIMRGDFLLFHKLPSLEVLDGIKVPRVCWYFDLVTYPDGDLGPRNRARKAWMVQALPRMDLGLMSDGDYVRNNNEGIGEGKLVHFTQGADNRLIGITPGYGTVAYQYPILFTGIRKGGGEGRVKFVDEMEQAYGAKFKHVLKGVYGNDMMQMVQAAQVVVAPNQPVTDSYWSNRVYLTLGFGGFLLHPWSAGLAKHYEDRKEIVYYRDMRELHELIRYYWETPKERAEIAYAGLARTRRDHTYKDRCREMVRLVEQRLHKNAGVEMVANHLPDNI